MDCALERLTAMCTTNASRSFVALKKIALNAPPAASSGEKNKQKKKHGCAKTLRWCGVKKRNKEKKTRAHQTALRRAKRATENDLGNNGLGTNPLGANRLSTNRLERNPMELNRLDPTVWEQTVWEGIFLKQTVW